MFCSGRRREFCSRPCALRSYRDKARMVFAVLPRPSCTCAECGEQFFPLPGKKNRKFCRALCLARHSSRNAKHKRRVRLHGNGRKESISLAVLFKRDHGVCQICRRAVQPSAKGWPSGASIDHIIPVSRGGEHTYENVQLAHIRCNTMRYAILTTLAKQPKQLLLETIERGSG